MEIIEAFATDVFVVANDYLRNRQYSPPHYIRQALADSIRHNTVDMHALGDAVGWVCHTLTNVAALSPDEIRIRDAAWRLSDAIHGMRVHYRPRFLRCDGTTD